MSAVVNNGPLFNAAPDVDEEDLNLSDLIGVVIRNPASPTSMLPR
jgi:hypothetical protein